MAVDMGKVDPNARRMFGELQREWGSRLPVNSAYRSPKENVRVGGAGKSRHMQGDAFDIDVSGMSKEDRNRLIGMASKRGFNGIGVYDNSLHFDTAGRRAWGPSHSSDSIPEWAQGAVDAHMVAQATTAPDASAFDPAKLQAVKGQGQQEQQPAQGLMPQPAQGSPQQPAQQPGAFDPAKLEELKRDVSPVAPQEMAQPKPADRRSLPRKAYEGVRDVIVGTGEFDAPEIGSSTMDLPEDMQMRARAMNGDLFYADSEAAMGEIVKKHFPEAEVFPDKKGNLYVRMPGVEGMFALDRSGVSPRDIQDFAKMGITGLTAVGGASIGKLFGPAFKYLGAAGGAAGESVIEQAASNWAGGKQDFDMGRVWLAGAFGLGGEAASTVLQYIGPKLWKTIIGAKKQAANPQDYVAQLSAMGVDPVDAEKRIKDALRRAGAEGFDDAALKRIADAEGLPVPVKLTTGQAMRDPAMMRQEDIARETTAAYGPDVQRAAIDKYREQKAIFFENSKAFTQAMGAAENVGEAGQDIQTALVKRRAAAKAGVGEAYEAARESPGQAIIGRGGLEEFTDTMLKTLDTKFTPSSIPLARELLDDLASKLKPKTMPGGAVRRAKGLDIRELENWRSRVSTTMRGKVEGSDQEALRQMLGAYDKASLGQLKNAIIAGDDATIQLWRDAVASRKKFARVWENEDIIDRISRTSKRGRRGELDVDPADVVSEILGSSILGTKKGSAREVKRLKEFFIESPETWGKIKGEAIVKLLGLDPRTGDAGEKFGTLIVGRFRKALERHPALMGELFTANERAALRNFAKTVERINTSPTFAASNASGSGFTGIEGSAPLMKRAVTWLGRQFGVGGEVTGGFVTRRLDQAIDARRDDAMRASLAGAFGPRRELLPGAGAAVGGAIGGEMGREPRNQ